MSTENILRKSGELKLTAERWVFEKMHPDRSTHEQHLARYVFALGHVQQMAVLDAACGAGYGSHLMRDVAPFVCGLDICPEAIAYARHMYAKRPGLVFCVADIEKLPFPRHSFQAVVSFETIEHISGYVRFLEEVRRVLEPGGVFIVSTPNRAIRNGEIGSFHKQEWLMDQFSDLLAAYFREADWFGQIWAGAIRQPFTETDIFIVGVLR